MRNEGRREPGGSGDERTVHRDVGGRFAVEVGETGTRTHSQRKEGGREGAATCVFPSKAFFGLILQVHFVQLGVCSIKMVLCR